jgi:2-phospho-L-lactate guanylyltransferase (CobY/MobA/RfbA family)
VRDIRKGLKERLEAALAERDRQSKLVHMLEELMAEEERRAEQDRLATAAAQLAPPESQHIAEDGGGLADLVLPALANAPLSVGDIKRIGEDWPPIKEAEVPGRSINFALVGLQKRGLVHKRVDGKWEITHAGRARIELLG